MQVDARGQRRLGVAPLLGREHLAHVGAAGQAEQATAVLEGGGKLGRRHADVLLEPQHEARVDAARTRRHDETVQRGETHGGVDRTAVQHGGERGPGAEMTAHEAQAGRRGRDELGDAACNVAVREAVKAEAAQVPALAPLDGQRVRGRRRRHAGVEGGVEARDRRHAGQGGANGGEGRERLGLVQRSEVAERLEPADHRLTYADRAQELGATVDDAMSHRVDRAEPVERRAQRLLSATPRGAGRSAEPTSRSAGSSSLSLRLLDPALTTSTRVVPSGLVRRATSSPGSRDRPRRGRACRHGPAGAGRPCTAAGGRRVRPGRARDRSHP